MRKVILSLAMTPLLCLGCGAEPEPNDAGTHDAGGCGEIGSSCDTSPECPEGQVCVDHVCDCALDRQYEVLVLSGQVYNRGPAGRCWDDDPPSCEDLPDVYLRIQIGDNEPFQTPVCESPSANEPYVLVAWEDATFLATIGERDVPQVWIYDVDGDSEELMGESTLEALDHLPWLTVENLRQGGLTLFVPTDGALSHEVNLIFSPR
jgi:hypothetical protein